MSVGLDSTGLSFGIVNDEFANCGEIIGAIRNASGIKFYGDYEDNCHYFGLSCLLIDTLGNEKKTLKVRYF